jgi:hypothetical protein
MMTPISNATVEDSNTGEIRSAQSTIDALQYDYQTKYWHDDEEQAIPHEDMLSKAGLLNSRTDSESLLNWEMAAEKAGLDSEEAQVLHARVRGLSRDKLVAACRTEAQQKRIVAAWKRMDRGKMDCVASVLKHAAGVGELNPPIVSSTSAKFIPAGEVIRAAAQRDRRIADDRMTRLRSIQTLRIL